MPKNFVSYANATSLMTGINNKKVGKSDLTDIFATGTTNNTGSEISSGTYFYLNDELVKAIDDIAVGDTFTEDTNYEVVNGVLNEETSTDGGHKIEDAAGNVLQQQDTMQFIGGLKATNDPTNGKTKIDDSPTLVTWEAWNAMTPEQRAAIPKAQITNVPGADGVINAEYMKVLWTNPSPTAAFAAQTITLSSDDYDFLLVIFNSGITSNITTISNIVKKGNNLIATECYTGSGVNNVSTGTRTFTYVTDTSYSFGDALLQTQGSARGNVNSIIIPMEIYGFKKTLSLNFSAIASDVSTLASKCMLEGGETSVEDEIDELEKNNFGSFIDISSYNTSSNKYTFPSDGYVEIFAKNGSMSTRIKGNDETGANLELDVVNSNASVWDSSVVMVRKGMKFYVDIASGTTLARFIPFV